MRGPRPAPLKVRLFSPSGNSQMATCAWLAQLVYAFFISGEKGTSAIYCRSSSTRPTNTTSFRDGYVESTNGDLMLIYNIGVNASEQMLTAVKQLHTVKKILRIVSLIGKEVTLNYNNRRFCRYMVWRSYSVRCHGIAWSTRFAAPNPNPYVRWQLWHQSLCGRFVTTELAIFCNEESTRTRGVLYVDGEKVNGFNVNHAQHQ